MLRCEGTICKELLSSHGIAARPLRRHGKPVDMHSGHHRTHAQPLAFARGGKQIFEAKASVGPSPTSRSLQDEANRILTLSQPNPDSKMHPHCPQRLGKRGCVTCVSPGLPLRSSFGCIGRPNHMNEAILDVAFLFFFFTGFQRQTSNLSEAFDPHLFVERHLRDISGRSLGN